MRVQTPLEACLPDALTPPKSWSFKSLRRFRTTSLALACEAMLIFGLLIWPLLNAPHLPRSLEIARIPSPINFAPEPVASHPAAAPNFAPARALIFAPPRIPPTIFRAAVHAALNSAPPPSPTLRPGMPAGFPGVPGGSATGPMPIEPPRQAAPRVRVIRRSERVEEGQLVRRVLPVYPPLARVARISGTVELLVLVGRDGRVKSVDLLSGNPVLAASTKAGVAQWRYRPAFFDGQQVEVETRVTVHFVLNE